MVIQESGSTGRYIEHFGIKGQKWGLRRFQSYETAPTRSGMVGTEVGEAAKERDIDEEKKKYSNDPRSMYKHADLYTTKELNDAINRFNAEDALKRKIKERSPIHGITKAGGRILENIIVGASTEVGKGIVKMKMLDAVDALNKSKAEKEKKS